MRFGTARETPDWANPGSLLERGGDFGFDWGTGGGLLSGLPSGAREIVGSIYHGIRSGRATVVISPTVPTIPRPSTPAPEEGEVVAHDWGHLGRELLGGVLGQALGSPVAMAPPAFAQAASAGFVDTTLVTPPSQAYPGVVDRTGAMCDMDGEVWAGGPPPKGYKIVNYCGQGVLRKIRRRRRRRMLSACDKNDISFIVGTVGKGAMASTLINRSSC